jgi:transposase
MKKSFIIGVDVSKLKLDLHCYGQCQSLVLSNNLKGFKGFLKWIKKEISKDKEQILVVMEYSGVYSYNLEKFLFEQGISYVKRPALDIKRSMGMKRGKTDKADARMISQYGWHRREELKSMKPVSQAQQELQQLMTFRDKMVTDKASYKTRLKELKEQLKNNLPAGIIKSTEQIVEILKKEINKTEKTIRGLLADNPDLENNYQLITSVRGISFVTAIHMLITTENFSRFTDPRKFACYSGVAPFEHTSGSSIRGKTKTSQLANKKIKSLLTMAAICAIKHDAELKAKYEQKLKQGKAKMSVINMIRFKLIERVFAVIKRQKPYILSPAA